MLHGLNCAHTSALQTNTADVSGLRGQEWEEAMRLKKMEIAKK